MTDRDRDLPPPRRVPRCGVCGRHRPVDGYTVCPRCAEAFADDLAEVRELYPELSAVPGKGDPGERGAPGFSSSPPGSVHVMSMRDPRSRDYAVRRDPECESTRPVMSIPATLTRYCNYVIKTRHYRLARPRTVEQQADFLGKQSDWLMQSPLGPELCYATRGLRNQLRASTGDPNPEPIGYCFVYVDDEKQCGGPIYMPPSLPRAPDEPIRTMPVLQCPKCGEKYDGRRLILLRLSG